MAVSLSSLYFGIALLFAINYSNNAHALQLSQPTTQTNRKASSYEISRRNALIGTAAASLTGLSRPPPAAAAAVAAKRDPTITTTQIKNDSQSRSHSSDPPPTISIQNNNNNKRGGDNKNESKQQRRTTESSSSSSVQIPRIGYSFYKTSPSQAARCTSLALTAGVRHLDLATQYGSNAEIAKSLQRYLTAGLAGLDSLNRDDTETTVDVLERLDVIRRAGEAHANTLAGTTTTLPPTTKRGRRESLFLSHKLSNNEQSTNPQQIRRSVQNAISTLGCTYLDMVSIHSPLTDPIRRMTTYRTLLDLRDAGLIRSVGVCNYGIGPLAELQKEGLSLPAVNQLELSPFNTHRAVRGYCERNGVVVGCAAWSKLSGVTGPSAGWAAVSKIAENKGMEKAQVLVRWSLQNGYACVPRSGVGSEVERLAIGENSYGGVNGGGDGSFVLSRKEMGVLDGLDVSYKAGKLGRRDGWEDSDVGGPDWDPTEFV